MNPLKLDLTNEASIKTAIDTIIANEGRIDVLVNNAGYGSYGAIEDVTIEEAKQQFEVNIFGLARITQLVLPHMRAQQSDISLIFHLWVDDLQLILALGIMLRNMH